MAFKIEAENISKIFNYGNQSHVEYYADGKTKIVTCGLSLSVRERARMFKIK